MLKASSLERASFFVSVLIWLFGKPHPKAHGNKGFQMCTILFSLKKKSTMYHTVMLKAVLKLHHLRKLLLFKLDATGILKQLLH